MRVAKISTIFALSSVTIQTHALPLAPREHQRPQAYFKRVPYSVVAVDGSSPSSASVAAGTQTKTVTQASEATETVTAILTPSILTIVATVTVSGPESEKTVFVTPTAPTMSTDPVSLSLKFTLNPSQVTEITASVMPVPVSLSLSSTSPSASPSSVSSASPSLSPPYGPFSIGAFTTSVTGGSQNLITTQAAISTISVSPLPASTRTLPEASDSLTSSSSTSSNSPIPTASELSQTLSPAQLPLPTSFVPSVPISNAPALSSKLTPFNTSGAANPAPTIPTTTYDDGSWRTSYPAWTPTWSKISISPSRSSIGDPSSLSDIEKYGAATLTPSTTVKSALPTGGVTSWTDGAYPGASLKSWNGTVV